jgi:ferredoxin
VPLKNFAFTGEEKERLGKERELRGLDLQNISPEELNQVEGSVMVKDETICIRCGLCAERCPVNAISMEAFEIFDQDFSLPPFEEIVLNP